MNNFPIYQAKSRECDLECSILQKKLYKKYFMSFYDSIKKSQSCFYIENLISSFLIEYSEVSNRYIISYVLIKVSYEYDVYVIFSFYK